jgi:hypothetical protein
MGRQQQWALLLGDGHLLMKEHAAQQFLSPHPGQPPPQQNLLAKHPEGPKTLGRRHTPGAAFAGAAGASGGAT